MSRAAPRSAWQSLLVSDELTKREKATIRANWQELTEHLPAPGVAWEWGELGVSERMKHYLRHHGLMVRDPDNGEKWQTSERLWMWMIDNAADDDAIGAGAEGQCKLPIDTTPSKSTTRSVHTTPSKSDGVNGTQVTLAGETVDPVNDEEKLSTELVMENIEKGTPSDRVAAAEHDAQTGLGDIGVADVVTLPNSVVTGLREPREGATRVAEARQDAGQATLVAWGVRVETPAGEWCGVNVHTTPAGGAGVRRLGEA